MGCGGSKSTAVVESNVDLRRHNSTKRSNDVIKGKAPVTADEGVGDTEQNGGNDEGVIDNQQRNEPETIERKIKQNVRQSAPYKIPSAAKTESPFDPSVNVEKYRNEPIPVFGRAAFPLSKDNPDLKIEDTFWPGKRALIPDYNQMVKLDKHAIEVGIITPIHERKNRLTGTSY